MVGSKGDQLIEGESKGGGDGIRIGDRHGRGGDMEHRQWGERLEWGGMEWSECRPVRREMVLPLPGGGHEGIRIQRHTDVNN